jgi:transcriptional regulator with XRE-family HTH domain
LPIFFDDRSIAVSIENFKSMQQPELGKKILELRKQKGLTQEELVELCNISVRTIQRIEAGEVTPRSFTLRTIFTALDYTLEQSRNLNQQIPNEFDGLDTPTTTIPEKTNFAISSLTISWVCGLIYFLTGFIEFAVDYGRFYENDLIFGESGYLSIKFIVLISYIYFIRGFYILGELYKIYLLRIAAFVLICLNIVFYSYDMISVYKDLFYIEYVLIVESIFYGIGGFLLGFATLGLAPSIGTIAQIAGGFKIASSVFLITVIFAWLGLLFLIPAVLFQIILLFKVVEVLKRSR